MIWTARDWWSGMDRAAEIRDEDSRRVLIVHGVYADHCMGYEVAAWPCPFAAEALNRLFPDIAPLPGGAA